MRRGSVNELGADYDVCEDSCNKVEDTGLKVDRKTKRTKIVRTGKMKRSRLLQKKI